MSDNENTKITITGDETLAALVPPDPKVDAIAIPRKLLDLPPEATIPYRLAWVSSRIGGISKDRRNDHFKFKFVSVDQIYGIVKKWMNLAGLTPWMNEVEIKTLDKGVYAFKYELGFTVPGMIAPSPEARQSKSFIGNYSNPQMAGAIDSYLNKYFIRRVLYLETGEEDADFYQDKDAKAAVPTAVKEPPSNQPEDYTGKVWILDKKNEPAIDRKAEAFFAKCDRSDANKHKWTLFVPFLEGILKDAKRTARQRAAIFESPKTRKLHTMLLERGSTDGAQRLDKAYSALQSDLDKVLDGDRSNEPDGGMF